MRAQESNGAPAGTVQPDIHAVEARDLKRCYGEGPTAVEALRGVSLDGHPRAARRRDGAVGFREVDPDAHPRRPRQADQRDGQIGGREITNLDDRQLTLLRREHIGFVFQFFNLLPMLSAEENVMLPLTIAGGSADRGWLDELLGRTGLARPAQPPPARALRRRAATRRDRAGADHPPPILFADEPTGNLDSKTGGEILDLLRASVKEYGQTIVMVTHEPRAAAFADSVMFLADGLIVKELEKADRD